MALHVPPPKLRESPDVIPPVQFPGTSLFVSTHNICIHTYRFQQDELQCCEQQFPSNINNLNNTNLLVTWPRTRVLLEKLTVASATQENSPFFMEPKVHCRVDKKHRGEPPWCRLVTDNEDTRTVCVTLEQDYLLRTCKEEDDSAGADLAGNTIITGYCEFGNSPSILTCAQRKCRSACSTGLQFVREGSYV
jgi:hypothetical protein